LSSILIVDDDRALCRSLEIQLDLEGHSVKSALNAAAGLELVHTMQPDLVLLDVNLPDESGMETLPKILDSKKPPAVIIMTGDPDNKRVVDAMRAGAFDFLRKPFDLDEVLLMSKKLSQPSAKKRSSAKKDELVPPEKSGHEMVGSHPAIVEIHKLLGLLSRSRISVLVQGESGTGKELAARILHEASSKDKPFVAINCAAVVPTLLESEFFGHEQGAFTGADSRKIGKLEFASGGTVFLDEIGDMPLELQANLLRVLQEEEFVRVGGLEAIPLRARIVTATHADLPQLIREGKFRKDLFYRLTVSTITLPPLRERSEDILDLTNFLLQKIAGKLSRPPVTIDKGAIDLFKEYNWPGNIRELENILTGAVVLAQRSLLTREDFDCHQWETENDLEQEIAHPVRLADAEKIHINKILGENKWNISQTARILDISPTTLRKKIADYHLKKH
jgi:DNA-binding NtrC family response regulator